MSASSWYYYKKIEKNKMGGSCSAFGAEEWRIQDFGEET